MLNKNILVLAAHPDDETLGAGATIAKLSSAGAKIRLITFTDGVGARNEVGNRNTRLEEVSKILGIHDYRSGQFPDNEMDTVSMLDICQFIESAVDFSPDLIFTHHPGCLNIDHSLVYRATVTVFRPQVEHTQKILAYHVPSSTDYNPLSNFDGNVYYDIDKFVDKKMAALKVYDDEMREYPHTRSYKSILNRMAANGNEVGLKHAEKFQLIRDILC